MTAETEGSKGGARVGIYAFLFVAVTVTGIVQLVGESWSPAFRVILVLHPVLGLLVAAMLVSSLFGRLRSRVPGLSFSLLTAALVILFSALVRAFTLQHLPIYVSNMIAGGLVPIVLVVGLFFFLRAGPLIPEISRVRSGWLNLALITFWLSAAVLGLVIVSQASRGRVPGWIFDFHMGSGFAAGVLGLAALAGSTRHRRGWIELIGGTTLALVGLGATSLVVNALSTRAEQPGPLEVHLSSIPLERRAAEERDDFPFPVDARWLEITAGCGGESCHPDIVDDVRRSVHDLSYRTPHMHKVLDLLATEEGEHNRVICAGCHVPGTLLENGPAEDDYDSRSHLSCVFCHSISDAAIDGPMRSRYTLDLPMEHLAAFVEAPGGELTAVERLLLHLNPGAHGRAFTREITGDDLLCQSCHHGQAREVDESLRCVDCHMSATELNLVEVGEDGQTVPGGGLRESSSHRFPGANSTLHHLLGHEEDALWIERFLSGEHFLLRLEELYTAPPIETRVEGPARHDQFFYAEMEAAFDPAPRPGQDTTLVLTTRNLGLGHAFPSSSLDLEEAWMEVEVRDAEGEVVLSIEAGPDGRIPAEAPRLGGYLMGLDGERVEHYRVWQVDHEVVERRLPVDGEITDRIEWRVPEESRRHLTVRARWRYRKLGEAFWRWAYPDRPEIPSPTVVEHFSQHRIPEMDAGS